MLVVTMVWSFIPFHGVLTVLLLMPASAFNVLHSCALPVGICVVLAASSQPFLPAACAACAVGQPLKNKSRQKNLLCESQASKSTRHFLMAEFLDRQGQH